MQVSVAAPHEVLNGGAGAPTAQPTYVLAGAPPQAVGQDLVKTEPGQEAQTFTIRGVDPSIQHQQNIVYSIQPQFAHQQPITVKTEAGVIAAGALSPPEHVTVAGGLPTTPVSSATPKTPKTMSAKKGNKKNVWVPGKPLTPKAREMMESGKGSMNQDGRWTCVECNRSLSNEWTLEQHIQTVHGERIFNCKSCNKAFKRRDHLLNHIKTIHKGLKPCKKCNVVFVNKEELRAHKMAVHLKLAPEDTAPPPLAKNTAQEVLQYMEEETPASTPAHRAAHAQAQQQQQTTQLTTQPAAAQQPVQVRSNNVVASYDNLLEGFSIPQGPGGQQVVVTINPQHLAQAGVATQPNGATAQPTTQPGHTVSQPAAQTVTYQTQQPISVVPVQMGQLQGGQGGITYITAPPTAGQPTAIPVNLANGTQVLQAPQVLEMNPSYAAQNGTTVNGSPVKPTITYSDIFNIMNGYI